MSRSSGQQVTARLMWMFHDEEEGCGWSGRVDTDYDPVLGVYAWKCPGCSEDVRTEDES